MKTAFFLIILALFFNSADLNAKSLKILWWNVHNFFDETDDPGIDDTVLTGEEYNKKLIEISEELTEIHADIVGMAEVENLGVLRDIAGRASYPYYSLISGNDPRGINVCLLSKLEFTYKTNKDRFTPYEENRAYKFSRDCPEAELIFDNQKIHILLNHLKSNIEKDNKSVKKRVAQVMGILDIISEMYQKDSPSVPELIIMGDFNSDRNTEPMNILQKSGLTIVNYLYDEDSVYTNSYKNRKHDIDYFMINEKILKTAKITDFKALHEKKLRKISDHFPLVMELDFP